MEIPGQAQDMLARSHLSAGLGKPKSPHGWAGGGARREGGLGFCSHSHDPDKQLISCYLAACAANIAQSIVNTRDGADLLDKLCDTGCKLPPKSCCTKSKKQQHICCTTNLVSNINLCIYLSTTKPYRDFDFIWYNIYNMEHCMDYLKTLYIFWIVSRLCWGNYTNLRMSIKKKMKKSKLQYLKYRKT